MIKRITMLAVVGLQVLAVSFATESVSAATAAAAPIRRLPVGALSSVTATSARNAWAVGGGDIVRWNGTRWRKVATPKLAFPPGLAGVSASSARNAWAAGTAGTKIVILHWNGAAWRRVRTPSPPGSSLRGVAAVSARSGWAVGYARQRGGTCDSCQALILRWNGVAWQRLRGPVLAGWATLAGVAALSARNAWAVGDSSQGALILHWNGTRWRRQPVKAVPRNSSLSGVAAVSARDVWAVGETGQATLIVHWNGTRWKRVPSPSPPSANILTSVAATSGIAWAVGETGSSTLILRWNGTAWSRVRSPNPIPGFGRNLLGVAVTSVRDAWAVGYSGGGGDTLILRWNGIRWRTYAP